MSNSNDNKNGLEGIFRSPIGSFVSARRTGCTLAQNLFTKFCDIVAGFGGTGALVNDDIFIRLEVLTWALRQSSDLQDQFNTLLQQHCDIHPTYKEESQRFLQAAEQFGSKLNDMIMLVAKANRLLV